MAMSKRDFEAIAEVIKTEVDKTGVLENERWQALTQVAQGIAKHAAQVNPRFDRKRFMEASGFDFKGAL